MFEDEGGYALFCNEQQTRFPLDSFRSFRRLAWCSSAHCASPHVSPKKEKDPASRNGDYMPPAPRPELSPKTRDDVAGPRLPFPTTPAFPSLPICLPICLSISILLVDHTTSGESHSRLSSEQHKREATEARRASNLERRSEL